MAKKDPLEIIREQDPKAIQEIFTSQKTTLNLPTELDRSRGTYRENERTGTEYQSEAISQYKVQEHDIFDHHKRPKKRITKDTGKKDPDGKSVLTSQLVDVGRVGLPYQKLIVNRRVGFMLSEPVQTVATDQEETDQTKALIALIDKIQDDNKMDYKNKEIARRMMSELEVAEIWYFVENKDPQVKAKFNLRMKIWSPDLGDQLFPLFDINGDMIAFARAYKIKEDNEDILHYDVYTKEFEYKYVNRGEWMLDDQLEPNINPIPNTVEKILINYYTQPEPEWADVQSMISRLELILSNHADVNDYFGSPILTVSGQLLGYSQKGESGKILQLENGAKANYLALASEPKSIEMEQKNLERFIYAMSQTPNISFEAMQGLGALSGVALKLMFLDAHMAVKNKEEIFGLGLQRRLNIIKAAIGKVIDVSMAKTVENIQLKAVMTPYLPQNDTEMITNLTQAITSGIMSIETATEKNPLVDDGKEELKKINAEESKQAKSDALAFNIKNPKNPKNPSDNVITK